MARTKMPTGRLTKCPADPGALTGLPLAVLLAAAGGMMILLSFPRFDLFWLAWFGPGCLVMAIRGRRFGPAFMLGLLTGFFGNLGGFYWISNMLQDFAHMSAWLSWVLTILLLLFQSILYALAAGLSAGVIRKYPRLPWLLVFPATYTAFEFAFPLIFPWYIANGQQLFTAVIQIADLFGAPGITFVLVLVSTGMADVAAAIIERRRIPMPGIPVTVAILLATLVYGVIRIQQIDARVSAAPRFRIGLVEADVGIWEKEAKRPDGSQMSGSEKAALLYSNLLKHQYISQVLEREFKPDLIIWPETSYLPTRHVLLSRDASSSGEVRFLETYPFPTDTKKVYVSPVELPAAGSFKDPLKGYHADRGTAAPDRNAAIRGFSTPVILGAASIEPDALPGKRPVKYNTAVMIDGDGDVLGMYRKTLLLIFGEYLPFERQFPFLRKLLPEAGVWTPGDGPRLFRLGDARIGMSICYEDLLAPFHRKMVELGPNLMVNITNDAWFGKTREPWLHLQLAELRSVETRMYMARATNTGISAFVDPAGRRVSHTSMENPEYLVADVALTSENTFYMRFGDLFAYACCILAAALALLCLIPGKNPKIARRPS